MCYKSSSFFQSKFTKESCMQVVVILPSDVEENKNTRNLEIFNLFLNS